MPRLFAWLSQLSICVSVYCVDCHSEYLKSLFGCLIYRFRYLNSLIIYIIYMGIQAVNLSFKTVCLAVFSDWLYRLAILLSTQSVYCLDWFSGNAEDLKCTGMLDSLSKCLGLSTWRCRLSMRLPRLCLWLSRRSRMLVLLTRMLAWFSRLKVWVSGLSFSLSVSVYLDYLRIYHMGIVCPFLWLSVVLEFLFNSRK